MGFGHKEIMQVIMDGLDSMIGSNSLHGISQAVKMNGVNLRLKRRT